MIAPAARPFISSAEVAELIGHNSARAFLHDRARLEDETLFPLPMPVTQRRNLRWRRDEVLAWVERNGRPRPSVDQPSIHLMRLAHSA